MTSKTLQKARDYEVKMEEKIAEESRPAFHLSARVGWMNDPNGFSYYNGEYHMFYQYHPYDAYWGPMHWGHAVSKDLLHWEYRPVAIAPDMEYDKDGCFSGSAVTLPDGRHLLMYTSVERKEEADGVVRDFQTQSVAIGDGMDYEKYENNPVLTAADLPEGCSRYDFRDPKMWQLEDGSYLCVIGNRPADGSGQILLFSSPDALNWKYEKILDANNNRYGKMWECPDFIPLDGKWVLLTSPQDMLPEGLEYHNGDGTICMIGSFDETEWTFTEEKNQAIDYGIDFYAPQTVLAPDGRRIMIGWMQNWDTSGHHPKEDPWFGQLSLPRELSLQNGRLIQKPVRELDAMRENKVEYKDVTLTDSTVRLEGVEGRKIDMELCIRPKDAQALYQKFVVRFAKDHEYHTELSFRPFESTLKVDRKFSGSRRALIHQRSCKVNSENGCLKLRVILDRFSAEVFANDGEQVMTTTFYTEQAADGIEFFADGSVEMDIVKYDLI